VAQEDFGLFGMDLRISVRSTSEGNPYAPKRKAKEGAAPKADQEKRDRERAKEKARKGRPPKKEKPLGKRGAAKITTRL
jgi:hypothetical protein